MNFILISPPLKINATEEIELLIKFFEKGLPVFHYRKPNSTIFESEEFLDKIPLIYHKRIVLHDHHQLSSKYNLKGLHFSSIKRENYTGDKIKSTKESNPSLTISSSFHRLEDFKHYRDFDYVFLSPVYESISKTDYKGSFNLIELKKAIAELKLAGLHTKIIALGGVTDERIRELDFLGFDGCAVIGAVWESKDPILALDSFLINCKKKE